VKAKWVLSAIEKHIESIYIHASTLFSVTNQQPLKRNIVHFIFNLDYIMNVFNPAVKFFVSPGKKPLLARATNISMKIVQSRRNPSKISMIASRSYFNRPWYALVVSTLCHSKTP